MVLGAIAEAEELIRRAAKRPAAGQAEMRRVARKRRPEWRDIVAAAEKLLGRTWREMSERHGDWGRDGVVSVATRRLGWRLVEVAREIPEVAYATLAQGVRRFRRVELERPAAAEFAARLRDDLSNIQG